MKSFLFLNCLAWSLFVLCVHSATNPQEFTLYSINADTPIDLIFSAPPQEMNLSITPKSLISLNTPNGSILAYDPTVDTLSTPFNLKFGSDIKLENEPNDIFFLETEQWKLAYFEDFQGTALGWSEVSLSSCGTSSNLFLGNFLS